MTPDMVVRDLWARFEARDWTGAGAYLAPDLRAAWQASGETFSGRDEYIEANRSYPGDWHAVLDEVVWSGDRVVVRLTVTLDGAAETCIAYYRVVAGLVTEIDEWWATAYAPPERRSADSGTAST